MDVNFGICLKKYTSEVEALEKKLQRLRKRQVLRESIPRKEKRLRDLTERLIPNLLARAEQSRSVAETRHIGLG